MQSEVKLNLACGQMYIDGYINIDNKSMYHGDMRVDVVQDIFTLQWENNSVDEILLSHFAMYISYQEMSVLLKRWYNWLRKGGRLIMETGNVKSIAKTILESEDPNVINGPNGVMQLFGWETTAGHKWAWCPETLGQSMINAGFEDIQYGEGVYHRNPERDFIIVGTK
jgi:hypothetical protein